MTERHFQDAIDVTDVVVREGERLLVDLDGGKPVGVLAEPPHRPATQPRKLPLGAPWEAERVWLERFPGNVGDVWPAGWTEVQRRTARRKGEGYLVRHGLLEPVVPLRAELAEPSLGARLLAAWSASSMPLGKLLVLAVEEHARVTAAVWFEPVKGLSDEALVEMAERYAGSHAMAPTEPAPAHQRIDPAVPVQVVVAVIACDGRLLLTQRRRDVSYPLTWECPGGKVEPGEAPEAALARELHEELGCRASVGALLFEVSLAPPDVRRPIRVRFFEADLLGERGPRPLVAEALDWFPAGALAGLPLTPANDRARVVLEALVRASEEPPSRPEGT